MTWAEKQAETHRCHFAPNFSLYVFYIWSQIRCNDLLHAHTWSTNPFFSTTEELNMLIYIQQYVFNNDD